MAVRAHAPTAFVNFTPQRGGSAGSATMAFGAPNMHQAVQAQTMQAPMQAQPYHGMQGVHGQGVQTMLPGGVHTTVPPKRQSPGGGAPTPTRPGVQVASHAAPAVMSPAAGSAVTPGGSLPPGHQGVCGANISQIPSAITMPRSSTTSVPVRSRASSYEPPSPKPSAFSYQDDNGPNHSVSQACHSNNGGASATELEKALSAKTVELDAIMEDKEQQIKELQGKLKAAHAAKIVMSLVDSAGTTHGRITKTMLQTHLIGTPFEDFMQWILSNKQFSSHDRDHSGTLEKVELLHAFEEFYRHPLQTLVQRTVDSRYTPRGRNVGSANASGITTMTGHGLTTIGRRSVESEGAYKPAKLYKALDKGDEIDLRLEDFYNMTNSAIPFKRVNRGFYKFGETTVELKIVNNKLMAQTEDGWNRGKFGPIEKFITCFETLEREKAGIPIDAAG